MKFCPNCGTQQEEGAQSCPNCGMTFETPAPVYADPTDHTAEFDPADISDNKVYAILPYLMGIVGLIVTLLARTESPYAGFHLRQFLKICVCEAIVTIVSTVLCWTIIVPIAGAVCLVILFILRVIGFFQVCKGRAKEPGIVCNLRFLK